LPFYLQNKFQFQKQSVTRI